MDWVFDNIQLLVAIAAAVAFWLNQRREARQRGQTPAEPPPLEPSLHELPPEREERPVMLPDELRRRILEQLGLPQPTPEPVAVPVPPPMPVPLLPPPLPEVPVPVPVLAKPVAVLSAKPDRMSARRAGLKAVLHSRGKVREAFLLREILGTPVGLRPGGRASN